MKIAVASGKGGTGKTTVSLALAESAGRGCVLLDCDVEEPNCHLFLAETVTEKVPVTIPLPEFAVSACSGCGECVKVCRFHALARLGKRVLVFPELCHSCGGCLLACQEKALRETSFPIGEIQVRNTDSFQLISGVMNVGYSMAPFVIRALKEYAFAAEHDITILDAPPGTSCSMVTAVRDSDYVILVTEPTPFGLHDLALAHQTLRELGIPCGVIINRADENNGIIEDYCRENQLPLLLRIPFSKEIAAGYSAGRTLLQTVPGLRESFQQLIGECRI
ncbi:MAG: ATP-binding protein [Lentisphaeria bacterium]|nr:ATP-binding protein [Lentisphaeria bacterium]